MKIKPVRWWQINLLSTLVKISDKINSEIIKISFHKFSYDSFKLCQIPISESSLYGKKDE